MVKRSSQQKEQLRVIQLLWRCMQFLFCHYLTQDQKPKKISFADDFSGVGTIQHLREWWDLIEELGPYIGYHPNGSKSTLVVKKQYLEQAIMIFANTGITITCDTQTRWF